MRGFRLAFSIAALGVAAPANAAPTILTFDQANSCTLDPNFSTPPGPCLFATQAVSPTYGSTPQLAVSYKNFDDAGGLTANYLNWTDEGLGEGSVFASGSNAGPENLEFIFTPLTGFEISLTSIESWLRSGVAPIPATYSLFNGNSLIATVPFAPVPAIVTGAPHTITNFSTGYLSGPLRVLVEPTTPQGISFDNITFDVRAIVTGGVPEPATWMMLIAGFGIVGGAMRRRSHTNFHKLV